MQKDQELTPEQLKEVDEAFDMFSNKTDKIKKENLKSVLQQLAFQVSEAEIEDLLNEANQKNGEVSKEDFVKLMAKEMNENGSQQELINCFQYFDKDGNGKISLSEMRHIMIEQGFDCSDEQVQEIFSLACSNNETFSEGISLQDFAALYMKYILTDNIND